MIKVKFFSLVKFFQDSLHCWISSWITWIKLLKLFLEWAITLRVNYLSEQSIFQSDSVTVSKQYLISSYEIKATVNQNSWLFKSCISLLQTLLTLLNSFCRWSEKKKSYDLRIWEHNHIFHHCYITIHTEMNSHNCELL